MTQKPVEVRVREKLASNMFDDEERGYLLEELTRDQAPDQTKVAAEQAAFEKFAGEIAAVGISDVELLKEALELDMDTIKGAITKIASSLPPEYSEAVMQKAVADFRFEQEKTAMLNDVALRLGTGIVDAMASRAQQHQKVAAEQREAQATSEKAPRLAQALSQILGQ